MNKLGLSGHHLVDRTVKQVSDSSCMREMERDGEMERCHGEDSINKSAPAVSREESQKSAG